MNGYVLGEDGGASMPFLKLLPSSNVIAWCKGQPDNHFTDERPFEQRRAFGARRCEQGRGRGSRRIGAYYYIPLGEYIRPVNDLLGMLAEQSNATDPVERQWLDVLAEDAEDAAALRAYADWLHERGHDDLAALLREKIRERQPVKVGLNEASDSDERPFALMLRHRSYAHDVSMTREDLLFIRADIDRVLAEQEQSEDQQTEEQDGEQ